MNPTPDRHSRIVVLSFPLLFSAVAMVLVACGGESAVPTASPAAATGPTPTLVCAEPTIDFGQVWEGVLLEHRFVLELDGPAPSAVENVKADCGCTVAELVVESIAESGAAATRTVYHHGDPISAGDRLLVNIRYDTRNKRGHAPANVALYTPQGRVEVHVRAEVLPWLQVSPERLEIPLMRDYDKVQRTIQVSSVDGTPFGLTHLMRAIPPEVSVRMEAVAPEADGRAFSWNVEVTLGPNMPRGSHVYPIELLTDQLLPDKGADGVHPAIRATPYVSLRVVGAVSLNPPSLQFAVVNPTETVARTLRVQGHDTDFTLPEPVVWLRPFRALAEGENFALQETAKLHVTPVPGENAWDVQLLFAGLDPSVDGNFQGTLVVETGHPDEPRIEANVSGVALAREGMR